MTMNSKLATLILFSTPAFGCAGTGGLDQGPTTVAAERGVVRADGPATRAVVAGPRSIHVYSEFAGGAIYAAPAVTGADADCASASARRGAADLRGDHVTTFTVAAGQVACLATATPRRFELLWHALRDAPAAAPPASPMFVARN